VPGAEGTEPGHRRRAAKLKRTPALALTVTSKGPWSPFPSGPRRRRTPQLDAQWQEAFKNDPAGFRRAAMRDLVAAGALIAAGLATAWWGVFIVTDRQGGLTLLTMAAFPLLIALAALDSYRVRRRFLAGAPAA
jgi:hypothetical protein